MKSFGNILEELGFDKDASPDTKKAFFQHLAMRADSKALKSQPKQKTPAVTAEPKVSGPAQMEFDFQGNKTKVS